MTRPMKEKKGTSVGRRIIRGLGELRKAIEDKEVSKRFTVRTVELDLEPHAYSGRDVAAIRDRLGVSQAVFAKLLGVSASAVQSWEQGKREPTKTVRRLMDEIRSDPQKWIDRLEAAATSTEVGT